MINFTVGPVQMDNTIRNIGKNQIPYFRTDEFSKIMFENANYLKKFSFADNLSKVIFLTCSGTGAMESTISNLLLKKDKVLIVNGGTFGKRFEDICELYNINFDCIRLNYGEKLEQKHLNNYENLGYTVLLINMHETSTGVLYDMDLVSNFCKRNNLFLIVDAISSFLADPVYIKKWNIDAMIISSQKAMACPPGISAVVLSQRAVERVKIIECKNYYFNYKNALTNMERGQTPFTPAVGVLLQINARFKEIESRGGVDNEINNVNKIAVDFRNKISKLPFRIFSQSVSNALTSIETSNVSAHNLFKILKDEYGIWVCPCSGELSEKVLRVGHIGNLTVEDNNYLINSLIDLKTRGILK